MATRPPLTADALRTLAPLERAVIHAVALGAVGRTTTWVTRALAAGPLRPPGDRRPAADEVRLAIAHLQKAGWLDADPRRPGQWFVAAAIEGAALAELLDAAEPAVLRDALAQADEYPAHLVESGFRFPTVGAAIARLRLEAFLGASFGRLEAVLMRAPFGHAGVGALMDAAVTAVVDEHLLPRLGGEMQVSILRQCLVRLEDTLRTGTPLSPSAVRAGAHALLARDGAGQPWTPLRWTLAIDALWSADEATRSAPGWIDGLEALLRPALAAAADPAAHPDVPAEATPGASPENVGAVAPAQAQAVQAAAIATLGRWAEAETAFEAALAALRKATRRRRELLAPPVAEAYVVTLLALGGAARLETALKFCLSEGGSRQVQADHPLGAFAHAIQMRQGIAPRDAKPFAPYGLRWGMPDPSRMPLAPGDRTRWQARAWLKEGAQAEPLPPEQAAAAQRLKEGLAAAGFARLAEAHDAALAILASERPPAWYFVRGGLERWEQALAALRAVGEPAAAAAGAPAPAESRLVWQLDVSTAHPGQVIGLLAFEQKRGVRGWGARKEVPLVRLQRGAATLAAVDQPLAAALRASSYGRSVRIDIAAALPALVGHPHVVLADAPDVFVELVEAAPELEVIDEGERLRVRLQPPIDLKPMGRWAADSEEEREHAALDRCSVWPDGPQRLRLVRLNDAQRRVAQLLGPAGIDLPRAGAAQLQEVLASLGSQFRVHADDAATAQAARDVPAEPRLRAELQPVGDGLQLRLVAAPFGDALPAGPRLVPGRGRARIVATIDGEPVGVQRDLALERSHLESLLDACPMLPEPPPDAPCEWLVDRADDALALLERLQPHHGVAGLDWPQGRPVRVSPGAVEDLALKVSTHADWLGIDGELKTDEGLVVSLQQLIGFAHASRSRFLPLGDGRYVALTQELRDRVADLAAVAEARAAKGDDLAALRVPTVAAPWLQAVTEGAQVTHDAAYAARLQSLDDARRVVPALPSTLQAELRPYQEEGFEWAMRLAAAGLGGCLADDMGLGKTLQALAVLLARGASGPALVVVPTSLLGNWQAEAARFAPALRVQVYGEQSGAVRREVVAALGPHDVLLVSYGLLQIDDAAFTGRTWATLILDEAQAIKNAAAKRSQAVFALQATFRLAMSGTPIENRLGELWSVMNACNPGLLGTAKRFNERFAGLIERQHDRSAQRILRRLIAPFVLRRTKAQVLADLPPRTELVLRVQGDEAERAHYEALRREAIVEAEKSLEGDAAGQAHMNILAALTRLRRAACDPRLVTPTLRRPGAKVQAFGELAQELVANGHKALVFSQFVDFLALLREPLDAAGIGYQYLDGATPAAERTRRVQAFQNGEGALFLISLKAGGFGLNLTVADYVVIADPWWNPAAEDQASGRAHRLGQQRPVTVYRLVNETTLEQKILSLHETKRALAEDILADDGQGAVAPPLARELLALMRGDTPGGEGGADRD